MHVAGLVAAESLRANLDANLDAVWGMFVMSCLDLFSHSARTAKRLEEAHDGECGEASEF